MQSESIERASFSISSEIQQGWYFNTGKRHYIANRISRFYLDWSIMMTVQSLSIESNDHADNEYRR